MNQAIYPRGMHGIQVQKDELTIQCKSDCMHTREKCGEGGADNEDSPTPHGPVKLNFEELSNHILSQVEACTNSRLLC